MATDMDLCYLASHSTGIPLAAKFSQGERGWVDKSPHWKAADCYGEGDSIQLSLQQARG